MNVPKPLLVALGAIVGAGLRWATGELLDHTVAMLLVVNGVGSFLLGALLGHRRGRHRESLRLWLGTGFCGGLTTFSTLAADVAVRFEAGSYTDGAGAAVIAFAGGLAAGVLGHLSVRRRPVRGLQ